MRAEESFKERVRLEIIKAAAQSFFDNCIDGSLSEDDLDFKKNRVICTFATADGNCTLGFVDFGKARPKSLIKG